MKKILIITGLLFSLFAYSQTHTLSNTDGGANYSTWAEAIAAQASWTTLQVNRGDVFYELVTIISINNKIIETYGTGAKPIVSGEVTQSGSWTLTGGGVYQISVTATPTDIKFLWVDNSKQPIGRTPNTGYYNFDLAGNSSSIVYDADRNEVNDYWNGCKIVAHTADWALETEIISDFTQSTGRFDLASAFDYAPGGFYDNEDMGYIIIGGTQVLDQTGEWFYNTSTNVLYRYGDPSGNTVTYAPTGNLMTITNSNNISISDIVFQRSYGRGVSATNSDNLTIDGCEFYYLNEAVYAINSDDVTTQNCIMEDIATNGIEYVRVRGTTSAIVSNNLNRIAIIVGEADDENSGDDMKAIHLNATYQNDRYEGCEDVLIEKNRIDSVGHTGIHYQMSNLNKIGFNWVSWHCQLKFDAGGIYAWHNADSAHIPGQTNYVINYDSSNVYNNYVELNYDALDKSWMSTRTGTDTIAQVFGLYWDDGNMAIHTRNNLVIGHAFNIFTHNTGHSVYQNNITYKARLYEYYNRNDLDANKDTLTDSDFIGNQWISYFDNEDLYKYENYFLYTYDTYNNTWNGNYYMYPTGHRFGTDHIIAGYNDVDGSFEWNLSEWVTWSSGVNEDIDPFSYSNTSLSTIDSLVFLIYNFSDNPVSTNDYFQDGYGYFNKDSTRIQEDTIEAYGSRVYLVDRGAYTYEAYINPCDTTIMILSGLVSKSPSGSIQLTVIGGQSPHSYLWSNSATTQNINGLNHGFYSVVVTDDNGCTEIDRYSVFEKRMKGYLSNGQLRVKNGKIIK